MISNSPYIGIMGLIIFNFLYASIGSISGQIVDMDTHQPLPGANIILENLKYLYVT